MDNAIRRIITAEVEGKEYECEVDILVVADAQYGADADGNRGMYAEFIEEVEIETIYDIKADEHHLPDCMDSELVDKIYDKVNEIVDTLDDLFPEEDEF